MDAIDIVTILIVLASVFTFVNIHYIKLPSTIGLMILAMALSVTVVVGGYFWPALTEGAYDIMTTYDFSEILLDIMLNFLLFAGALTVNLKKLREYRWTIFILTIIGVLISTFVVGYLTFLVLPWFGLELDFIYCLLFGALISPTDPIAVLAIMTKLNVSENLEIKIAGESLFNDGVGVVIFLTILGVATAGVESVSVGSVAYLFGSEVFGGLILGSILGYIGFLLLKAIDNKHTELEVLITLSLVMLGATISEFFHFSGPLASVVTGLFIGNKGRSEELSGIAGEYVFKFWHLLDEALNAILFILIGLQMIIVPFKPMYFAAGMLVILIALFARWVSVGVPIAIISLFKPFEKHTIKLLTWGGLKGGISVALALYLPDFEGKDLVVAITYSVVVFSIIFQGLSIAPLLKWLYRNKKS
ncbi:MAG TPA: sodium:proton antiporter [Cyclobacteriaceae bacterium]|mgnify:CR=1 FL=1|nr:sodium:proton antiporter [Cyclobacteriaceae bacterium]